MSLEEGEPSVKRARLILLQEPSDGLVRSQNNGKNSFVLGDNDETSFLIGRSEGAGCLVTHVGVSRRHATLNFRMDSVQGATWSVKDLKVCITYTLLELPRNDVTFWEKWGDLKCFYRKMKN